MYILSPFITLPASFSLMVPDGSGISSCHVYIPGSRKGEEKENCLGVSQDISNYIYLLEFCHTSLQGRLGNYSLYSEQQKLWVLFLVKKGKTVPSTKTITVIFFPFVKNKTTGPKLSPLC